MDLKDLRSQIDCIDDEIIRLFVARMEIAAQVADYKKMHDLPILMPDREREKLQDVANKAGPEMADYVCRLYATIFELSREHQSKQNHR